MAKPIKINAEYFSHDADMRNDVKVKALRRRFGHTGYAVWNYLLEVLTDADGFEIVDDRLNRELYSADFDIPVTELDEIIAYACEIGLLQTEDGVLFSAAHKRRLQAVSDRKAARSEAGRLGGIRSGAARRAAREAAADTPAATTTDTQAATAGGDGLFSSDNEANAKQNEPMLQQNEAKEKKGKETKENESEVMAKRRYPCEEVVSLWNSTCTAFPKVVKLTDGRRAKIRTRLEEFTDKPEAWLPFCGELFQRVQASEFLRGDNNHGWQASFDWLFENGSNWVKVVEGNYDNKGGYRPAAAQQRHTQDGMTLGVGEYVDPSGRRTYGSGAATIPPTAPPRPSDRYSWNPSTAQWVLL